MDHLLADHLLRLEVLEAGKNSTTPPGENGVPLPPDHDGADEEQSGWLKEGHLVIPPPPNIGTAQMRNPPSTLHDNTPQQAVHPWSRRTYLPNSPHIILVAAWMHTLITDSLNVAGGKTYVHKTK